MPARIAPLLVAEFVRAACERLPPEVINRCAPILADARANDGGPESAVGTEPGKLMLPSVMLPATPPACVPAMPWLLTWSTLFTITKPLPFCVMVVHWSDVAAA